ncbi:MAG: hypothetical protein HC810_04455 [Acaryochloridaceae cyanobacterium RL_2_7]|nr:hypothetical protein [Acaryochloridaceae cyanobacterium RL_2_7]
MPGITIITLAPYELVNVASSNTSTPVMWIRYGLILGFAPILTAVLGLDSLPLANQGDAKQWLADLVAIAYFALILQGLTREERRIAIAFVPFSAVAEYIFSQVLKLYIYRLEMVPLYVPFGHAILLSTGLVLADLDIFKKWEALRWVLLTFHITLFGIAIAIWHDWLSALLAVIFLWVIRRKGVRLLYGLMGCLVLIVELIGTSLGCWEWQADPLNPILHTTNPPGGGFCLLCSRGFGGI